MDKKKILILVIGIIALLSLQAKVVMPLIYDIAASDLFLEDTGSEKNRISSSTSMTDNAFEQCNLYITTETFPDSPITFSEKPIGAFALGNYEFIINSELEISPPDEAAYTQKYACKIKYLNKDDLSNISNPESWSISGISGLDS
ncbi:MAG: hypothetical protein KAH20_08305 [Methylococcales bacterium]|nr:hypothetical protein [Methylococcales bacterium]